MPGKVVITNRNAAIQRAASTAELSSSVMPASAG